jgi:hypothetical protein
MDRPRSAGDGVGVEQGKGYRFLPKRVLAAPLLAAVNSEWIYVRLAFVESLDGFKDLRPGKFTRDDEIIVNHYGLEPLFIQVRSECVTLCFGELTRVCAYPPKFVLKSQDPRFHGDIESELLIPVCICERPGSNFVQCLSLWCISSVV